MGHDQRFWVHRIGNKGHKARKGQPTEDIPSCVTLPLLASSRKVNANEMDRNRGSFSPNCAFRPRKLFLLFPLALPVLVSAHLWASGEQIVEAGVRWVEVRGDRVGVEGWVWQMLHLGCGAGDLSGRVRAGVLEWRNGRAQPQIYRIMIWVHLSKKQGKAKW